MRFICADLPLTRMPDRSDNEEVETSSDDDRYIHYYSDVNDQEREDQPPKIKNNTIKLT